MGAPGQALLPVCLQSFCHQNLVHKSCPTEGKNIVLSMLSSFSEVVTSEQMRLPSRGTRQGSTVRPMHWAQGLGSRGEQRTVQKLRQLSHGVLIMDMSPWGHGGMIRQSVQKEQVKIRTLSGTHMWKWAEDEPAKETEKQLAEKWQKSESQKLRKGSSR